MKSPDNTLVTCLTDAIKSNLDGMTDAIDNNLPALAARFAANARKSMSLLKTVLATA